MSTLSFMKLTHILAFVSLACLAVACGDGEPAEPSSAASQGSSASTGSPSGATGSASSPAASPAKAPLTEQATAGQKLFEAHCTKCHGASVSVSRFDTAADFEDYIAQNMPRDAPGSLTQPEYFSIVAFDLAEKGVDLHGETLDAANAGSVSVR